MSHYNGNIEVIYNDNHITNIKRLVVDKFKKDVVVYMCKFYEVKMNYRKGHGLYIDLNKPLNFMVRY